MITTVSTSADLVSALKVAQSGDTIELNAGVYSTVTLQNANFSGAGVTITSADPTHEATLTGLMVKNDTGLNLSKLEFNVSATQPDNAYEVLNSANINLDHLNVHGSLDGNPQNDLSGVMIRSSTNVSLTNSEFQQLHFGVTHLDDTGLTISGNNFHDIRTDGIRGGGSSNVTVSNNTFTNFFPDAGDHGDAIQFWTTNTTTSAHDITITNNMFMRGAGDVAQGVFVTDQVGDLPYLNLNISNNTMIGSMYNGIMVQDAIDPTVTHNTVVGLSDMTSWVRLESVTGGNVSDNSANHFLTDATDSGVTMTNDVITAQASDDGAAAYAAWQAGAHITVAATAVASTSIAAAAVVPPSLDMIQAMIQQNLSVMTLHSGDFMA
jgi:parallel beta-helix repeat protein